MRTILCFLVLAFGSLSGQVLLTENFTDWISNRLTAKTSHFWVLDSQWVADNSTSVLTDQEGSTTLTEAVASWPAWSFSNPEYPTGNTMNFAGGLQALTAVAAPTDNFYGCRIIIKPTSIVNAAASAQQLLHLEGGFYGIELGAASGSVANEIVTLTTDGGASRSYWASATDSISALDWNVLVLQWDGAKYQIWLNGVEKTTSTTGTPAVLALDTHFRIGIKADNTRPLLANVASVKLYDQQLTDADVGNESFVADGWVSLSGGVTRADSADTWMFHQGIIADTVYYATTLTAGNWSITVNVDGDVGGESLRVLTSANASTWSTLGTISATTTATDYTVTGSGLGYVGFGLASGTVYLDNLTVSIIPSTATNPRWQVFKQRSGWKTFINR